MKCIAFERPDGGVSLVTPAPNFVARFKDEAEALVVVQAKSVPDDAATVVEISETDVPNDRVFRDAWILVDGKPDVDMLKARVIHMDNIRQERVYALEIADVEVKKAEDDGDATKIAEARAAGQSVRDIPQTFDLSRARTPKDLQLLWPAELRR